MTIEQSHVIDGIGTYADCRIDMVITDHLTWDEPDHIPMIVRKIEAYAHAVKSKQTMETIPRAEFLPYTIVLVHKYTPPEKVLPFLNSMRSQLNEHEIGFEWGSISSFTGDG